ncbi:MAG TPA: transposase [Paludibacter sp.]
MIQRKSTNEEKLEAVQNYLQGKESIKGISLRLSVDKKTVRQWIGNYESQGKSGVIKQPKNARYSQELKTTVVGAYLAGKGSQTELCKKFHLRSTRQLYDWIKAYNGHKELRSSGGLESEIYMTKGKSTTLAERIEIVSFCIEHNKNYSETIEKYGVSYQQIYAWVRKYEEKGAVGLEDKRGKRKPESEMTDTERIKAENRLLQARNRHLELENKLLKKLEELERRGY